MAIPHTHIPAGPVRHTIQQYLRAGLIDDLHFAIALVLLDMRASGYECTQFVGSAKATHVVLRRKRQHGAWQLVLADDTSAR